MDSHCALHKSARAGSCSNGRTGGAERRQTHPGVLEGTLVHLSGLLLELLDHTLVNTAQLVDQVTGGRGLAGVDMSNDDDVQVSLLLTHGCKS